MSKAVKIHLLTENEFKGIKSDWNGLLEKSNVQSFFLKWEWLYSYWETVQDKRSKLHVYLFKVDSKIIGILPLYVRNVKFYSIPIRKLSFLGNDVASDFMDIICLPDYQEVCCNAFYQDVFRNRRKYSEFTLLEFQSLSNDSYLYTFLKNKQRILFTNQTICPRVVLPDKFEDYLKNYKHKRRWQIRDRERQIYKKFDSVDIEFCTLKDNKNLIDILFDLHKKRWEIARNESSRFYNDYRKKFNYTFLAHCNKDDVLFSLVKINNEIASIMYMFKYKNNIFYYQNGWLPKYSKFSIGLFHIYKVIDYSITKKYNSFDLLRGDENYKLKLKGENRITYTLLYFNTSFTGTILRMLYIIIQNIKPVIKKIYTLKGQKT